MLGLEGALVDRGRCEDERDDVDGGEDDGEREECVEEHALRLGEHLAHTRADDGGRHLRRNVHGHRDPLGRPHGAPLEDNHAEAARDGAGEERRAPDDRRQLEDDLGRHEARLVLGTDRGQCEDGARDAVGAHLLVLGESVHAQHEPDDDQVEQQLGHHHGGNGERHWTVEGADDVGDRGDGHQAQVEAHVQSLLALRVHLAQLRLVLRVGEAHGRGNLQEAAKGAECDAQRQRRLDVYKTAAAGLA